MSRALGGILSSSNFVKTSKIPGKFFIVNTSQHWVFISTLDSRCTLYWDPLAEKPPHSLAKWMKSLGCYKRNTVKVQTDSSDLCGLFIVFVLYFLVRGVPISKIMKKFSSSRDANDKKVAKFAYERFGFDATLEIKV